MKKFLSILLCVVLLLGVLPSGVFSVGALTSGYYTYTVSNGEATITDCDESISGDITIPSTLVYKVTAIGDRAFYNCTSLKSITIPNGVTSIGNSAFNWCTSLKSITIPNSVISIGDYAFSRCGSLTSITIPDSVTSIGDYVFSSCSSLTSITVSENNKNYSSVVGVLFNKDKTTLICCPAGKKSGAYTIPKSVTNIGDWAFYNCESLTSITIPDSVTSIGDSAFSNCTSLTDVYYTGSQEDAGKISIGSYNSYLTNATWHYEAVVEDPWYLTYTVENGEATITDCDTSISGDITIPSTLGGYPVTSIGERAFQLCKSLTSITIPDSVTSINDNAFYWCTSLTSITIPEGVTSIGNYAFDGCYSLTSITIPDSVTSIGKSAFSECKSLTSITIPEGVTSIGDDAFYWCTSLTSITIPNSVTSIADRAFGDCTSLTSITIPDSVTSIGNSVFSSCSSLTSITIPRSVTTICDGAFNICSSLKYICYTGSTEDAKKITMGSGNSVLTNKTWIYNSYHVVGSTYTYAVSNGNATILYLNQNLSGAVNIPSTLDGYLVTVIGDSVFYDYDSITSVTIPDSVTTIGNYAFNNCTSLTNVTIPDSVTSIGSYAFVNCTSLTNITIPDSVTTIGYRAFSYCKSLTSVTLPNGVKTIGGEAFYKCTSLTNITISDSVTTIGYGAFSGCSSLTDVYYNGTQEDAGKISIGSYNTYLTNATWHYTILTEMIIEKSPNKTVYYLGDNLDLSGIKVVLNFSNETSKDITNEVTLSGFDTSTTGIKIVTVTYNNFTATFRIVVTTPSINITSGEIIDIVEGNKQTINVRVSPANQELTWTSFDTSIATVENGVVKAIAEGTTAIVAEFTYNGVVYSDYCVINVHQREWGDINGDFTVDQTDYQYIADIYTGKVKVDNKAEICDINGDGKFDIRDIIAIREIINA